MKFVISLILFFTGILFVLVNFFDSSISTKTNTHTAKPQETRNDSKSNTHHIPLKTQADVDIDKVVTSKNTKKFHMLPDSNRGKNEKLTKKNIDAVNSHLSISKIFNFPPIDPDNYFMGAKQNIERQQAQLIGEFISVNTPKLAVKKTQINRILTGVNQSEEILKKSRADLEEFTIETEDVNNSDFTPLEIGEFIPVVISSNEFVSMSAENYQTIEIGNFVPVSIEQNLFTPQ